MLRYTCIACLVCGYETWLQNQRNHFEDVLRISGTKTDRQQALPMKTKDFRDVTLIVSEVSEGKP